MKTMTRVALGLGVAASIAGCAQIPAGPTVQVLPGANKPFEKFQEDQILCKAYAHDQVAGQSDTANERALAGTLIGAALGAGVGAATGGGHGAGVGAAVGGLGGTAIGAMSSDTTGKSIQDQYNNAYSQCMYAKGNQVIAQPAPVHVIQQAPAYYAPPPPVVYTQPPVIYSQPQAPAQPQQPQGYQAPAGAAAPPPNTAAPQ